MTPSPSSQPPRAASRNGVSRASPAPHDSVPPAPNSPEGRAHLATLLADAYRDIEGLRKDLAYTRKRLEKSERVLSAIQVASPSSTTSDTTATPPVPERVMRAITEAENRAEHAERERDELATKLATIAAGWSEFERYMLTAEVRLQDARSSFSRIVSEGAGSFAVQPLSGPSQSSPLQPRSYPAQAPSSHALSAAPTSRSAHQSSYSRYAPGAAHAPAPAGAPTQGSFFGNMALPPPPNIGRRPREDSLEASAAYSNGLHPNKKLRGVEHEYQSSHLAAHYSKPADWPRWVSQDEDRGRSRRTHDSHARSTARTHPRSRSASRSSATSLSVDEMLLEATDEVSAVAANTNHSSGYTSQHQWDARGAYGDDGRHGAHSPSLYRKRGGAVAPASPRSTAYAAPKPTVGPGTAASLTAPPASGPLSQPGQVQTYQTHIFAPPVTGAPVKKTKSYNTPTPAGATGGAAAATAPLGPGGFPPTNADGQRICRQCGLPGRYKDNKCVEKWGPGPEGPGTVCDRCRKKMKRVERRGTMDQPSQGGRATPYSSLTSVLRPPLSGGAAESQDTSDRGVHRTDTALVGAAGHGANPYPPSPRSRALGPGGTQLVLEGPGTTVTRDSVGSSRSSRASPPSPAPPIATLENEPASPTRMLEDAIDASPVRGNGPSSGQGDDDEDVDAEGSEADADGDADMDLLEAVDAAETNEKERHSRATSVVAGTDERWLKAEE